MEPRSLLMVLLIQILVSGKFAGKLNELGLFLRHPPPRSRSRFSLPAPQHLLALTALRKTFH